MADPSPPQTDLKTHARVYDGFIGWVKWGTIIAAVITAIVVILIAY